MADQFQIVNSSSAFSNMALNKETLLLLHLLGILAWAPALVQTPDI